MTWDDFAENAGKRLPSGPPCGVRRMLDEDIPEEARATVVEALDNTALHTASIARELVKRLGNKAPSKWVIGAHRRHECGCTKEDS